MGLEKGLNKPNFSGNNEKAASSIATGYVFGSRLFERVITAPGANNSSSSTNPENNDVSSIFKRIAEKTGDAPKELWKSSTSDSKNDMTNGSGGETNSERLKASVDEMSKKNQTCSEFNSVLTIETGEEGERNLINVILFYLI